MHVGHLAHLLLATFAFSACTAFRRGWEQARVQADLARCAGVHAHLHDCPVCREYGAAAWAAKDVKVRAYRRATRHAGSGEFVSHEGSWVAERIPVINSKGGVG